MDELTIEDITNQIQAGNGEIKAQSQTEWWLVQDASDKFVEKVDLYGRVTMTQDKNKACKFDSLKAAEQCIHRSPTLIVGKCVVRTLKRITMTIDLL